jgi:hypothetical protein
MRDGTCSTHGINEKFLRNVRKYEGKRPLGSLRRIWEDNIKMYLK